MIKEIEVGGVKHSITLADDMIGKGLVKGSSGEIRVDVFETPLSDSIYMSGIVFSGSKLLLLKNAIAQGLSGSGLEVEEGQLRISTNSLVRDGDFISGLSSGLAIYLAGSGLVEKGGKLVVSGGIDVNALSGVGLWSDGKKLYLYSGIAGSGLFYRPGNTPTMAVCVNRYSGLDYIMSNDYYSEICVKIAKRTSGLRLFFNEDGELDVTQN